MKTICIINQKGGVAKTTTAVNLAYYFKQKGLRVLVVDTNEQANLSSTFIKEEIDPSKTLFRFMKGVSVEVMNAHEGLDIIPSNDEITGLDSWILSDPRAKLSPVGLMRKVLNQVADDYDVCIIDSPAQTGLITANSLSASDYVLIPVKTSEYSNDALDKTIDYVLEIKENINPDLKLLGIFLTFFDSRYNASKHTLGILQKSDLEEFLLESRIRQTQLIVNIEKQGSLFENYANTSVANDYAALAEEILAKMDF